MSTSRWDNIKLKRRDSPWIGIPAQTSLNWKSNFLWGLDPTDHPVLSFETRSDGLPCAKLPSFSGVECHQFHEKGISRLVFRLSDFSLVDIFDQYIDYLVSSVDNETSESAVYAKLISRSWRWHYLLKSGGNNILTKEEQKGLLAEVYLLQYWLSPHLGVSSSIDAWTGPSGAPKDFETATFCIEVKARRPGSVDSVQISSSDQLADVPRHELLLAVFNIDFSDTDSSTSFSFSEWISQARTFVMDFSPLQLERLDALLYQAGYDDNDEYLNDVYLAVSAIRFYRVVNTFPRITPDMHSASLDHVKYRLSLSSLEDYVLTSDQFITFIHP